jgi:N-acyl-D-aspartate/D-glutamate deacylase
MGKLAGQPAARTIDARGLLLAPGFIDIHDHSDSTGMTPANVGCPPAKSPDPLSTPSNG